MNITSIEIYKKKIKTNMNATLNSLLRVGGLRFHDFDRFLMQCCVVSPFLDPFCDFR